MKLHGTVAEPLIWFVYSAIAVTGLCGILYVCVQQSFRQNLDDPQIQLVEDAARALVSGKTPGALVQGAPFDIAQSLSPWVVVYDSTYAPLVSSGILAGKMPSLPPGTYDDTTWLAHKTYMLDIGKETRFTWQPAEDTRQAVVLVKIATPGGVRFVAVGRNMREIEARIEDVGLKVFVAWVCILGALFVASFCSWFLLKRQP